MPSTVATPSPAPSPTVSDVRAVSATIRAATAPTGMAIASPVTRPERIASRTAGFLRLEGARGHVVIEG